MGHNDESVTGCIYCLRATATVYFAHIRMLIWSRALAIARAVSYRTFGGKTWSMSAVPLEHMASLL